MCGIAGIYNYADPARPVDRNLLLAMTRSIAHRGPDAEGIHIEGPIGLGHRRLSIVDLSETGAQPMPSSDRKSWLIYNGEFYNHLEFRQRLQSRGICFRGTSDTETLLYLLRELGPEALESAAGIFGFGFWDGAKQQLTLGRDPLGVKQVYYHDDGRRLIFASEIKALLMDPTVRREADPLAVSEYLHFHTPLFERTFFAGIRQVRQGEYLTFNRYRSQARTYWRIDSFEKGDLTAGQHVEELARRIEGVVQDQLMADVPVATFFSGGIDSTAVAAFASRHGKIARCFGVHFQNQGVIDERPYQEAAAKSLGLDLQLTTLDGRDFPSDISKLLYFQDQPVIGPAMMPMYAVSKLAAQEFKVCLGGQASDEVFGGYARYALARPMSVIRNWFAQSTGQHVNQVGGNLSKQLAQKKNLSRLLRNAGNLRDWQTRYFESFAKVPIQLWRQTFDLPDLCDREHCRRLFEEETRLSPATDPADKIMEWDLRTYLTGLFQQDDRMSMAVGLESRVPLADPRLVRHAFRIPYDLKFRRGATKWVLREAIADIVPEMVLNRVKVGFDTPVEAWMRGQHASFVRDTLLSRQSRGRGFWSLKGLQNLIEHPDSAFWLDRIWKVLSIEVWARTFLDGSATNADCQKERPYVLATDDSPLARGETAHVAQGSLAANLVREVRELGVVGTLARSSWEFKTRSGLLSVTASAQPESGSLAPGFFTPPAEAATAVRCLADDGEAARLLDDAVLAAHGSLKAFGNWFANYGQPLRWHLNPVNGRAFRRTPHWSRIYADQAYAGDIKLAWEAGRFPQCFHLGRAAAFHPQAAVDFGRAAEDQILQFINANPVNYGVQWASGQEVALRLLAWTFALDVLPPFSAASLDRIAAHVAASTQYVEDHIEYAQRSVYNNHLISEAFGLLLGGLMLPECPSSQRWVRAGIEILDRQADRQVYPDGAYISQSHNYERSVLHVYLAAMSLLRSRRMEIPQSWLDALARAFDFLYAQQNETDGRLPNYGGNDGAMPLILSTCDYPDFRPTLQAVSVACRGERAYPRGPWDEMAVWLLGVGALASPLRADRGRTSVSFGSTGYHVLRSSGSSSSFAVFRCGSLKDRFSQIDMLHTDIWWRGENVCVDPGTFLYNGPSQWHAYFYGTASHNTVTVDGRDQMLHLRKFKCLYPTEAKLLSFRDDGELGVMQGEQYGFARHPGRCVHRRTVIHEKNLDLWVIVDDVTGDGSHRIRLHWQAGDYEFAGPTAETPNRLRLWTPQGGFDIGVYGSAGQAATSTNVMFGQTEPQPRGWVSRYYGVKTPAPSLEVLSEGPLPVRLVTVLGSSEIAYRVQVDSTQKQWRIDFEDNQSLVFESEDPSVAYKIAKPAEPQHPREEPVLSS